MYLANLLKKYGNHPTSDKERFFNTFEPPYIIQPKLDGMRVFLIVTGDSSIIVNRRGLWRPFPLDRPIPEGIYDGELVGIVEGPQFVLKNPTLTLFDIVEPHGDLPLKQRLLKLEEVVGGFKSRRIKAIHSLEAGDEDASLKIAKQLIEDGHEGAVIKANLPYHVKGSWLKIKRRETIDLAILAVKKTKSLLEHGVPESFLVGYPDGTKVTDVSSGLSKEEKKLLLRLLKPVREDADYIYVTPEIILEIAYQQKLKNGLRHPRIVRVRWDK